MRTLTRLPFAPSRRTPAPRQPSRARRGFTIVEAIVSIVMLAAGVLALVSSSAVVLREMNAGSQNSVAAAVASQRLERLRSFDQCASIVNGSGSTRGMTESWTVAAVLGGGGQPSRTVTYTISYQAGRTMRQQQFVTNIPCT
jgi:Tfp pilus assembly protein PilV